MLESLFIMSSETGEVLVEKHFRSVTPRSVVDLFWEALRSRQTAHLGRLPPVLPLTSTVDAAVAAPGPAAPVIPGSAPLASLDRNTAAVGPVGSGSSSTAASSTYLIHVYRDAVILLAVVASEVSPSLVIELLHRIVDVVSAYVTPPIHAMGIKENFSIVYQLLEELLDYGFPLITEPNSLHALVAPPSLTGKIVTAVTGSSTAVADHLPSGAMSSAPWRRKDVRYTQNEVYFDIVEELDCIMSASGSGAPSHVDVRGAVNVTSHLSGFPDLLLEFDNPSVIADCSFHPSVRISQWDRERALSFIPPDGRFQLMRYRLAADVRRTAPLPLPVYCTPTLTWADGVGKLHVTLAAKHIVSARPTRRGLERSQKGASTASSALEGVGARIPLPDSVRNVDLRVNQGKVYYDEMLKEIVWDLGRLAPGATPAPSLHCTLSFSDLAPSDVVITAKLQFTVPGSTMSGLRVGTLTLHNEAYAPFKGVKSETRAGNFEVRI